MNRSLSRIGDVRVALLCLFFLWSAAARAGSAEEKRREVRLLHDTVSVQLTQGWTIVKDGDRTQIRPPNRPLLDVAYIEIELQGSHTTDENTLTEVVKLNARAKDVERLSDGRFLAYSNAAIGSEAGIPHWNVIKAIDRRSFAIVLFSTPTTERLQSFLEIVRSVRFTAIDPR